MSAGPILRSNGKQLVYLNTMDIDNKHMLCYTVK